MCLGATMMLYDCPPRDMVLSVPHFLSFVYGRCASAVLALQLLSEYFPSQSLKSILITFSMLLERRWHITRLLLGALCLCCGLTEAQTVQNDWVRPAGPDNSTTLYVGRTFQLQWTSNLFSWFATYAPGADVTDVDLWITDFYLHVYEENIASKSCECSIDRRIIEVLDGGICAKPCSTGSVNINASNSIPWLVQLDPAELSATPYWVFRFVQSGFAPSETKNQISSPGIYIVNQTVITTTSSASSTQATSTSTQTTSSASSVSSAASTSTPTSTTEPVPSARLSTGAKAGIAVGAVAGAALLLAAGWSLAHRRPSKAAAATATQTGHKSAGSQSNYYNAHEKQSNPVYSNYNSAPQEMEGSQLPPAFSELGGHTPRMR